MMVKPWCQRQHFFFHSLRHLYLHGIFVRECQCGIRISHRRNPAHAALETCSNSGALNCQGAHLAASKHWKLPNACAIIEFYLCQSKGDPRFLPRIWKDAPHQQDLAPRVSPTNFGSVLNQRILCRFLRFGASVPGCADSRVPLETVFDALPGDLFVLRNAGNTCPLAAEHVARLLQEPANHWKVKQVHIYLLGNLQHLAHPFVCFCFSRNEDIPPISNSHIQDRFAGGQAKHRFQGKGAPFLGLS